MYTEPLIEEPEINTEPLITISNPHVVLKFNLKMDVGRISLLDDVTRIDFIHYPDPKYINGGWIQISAHTFIRIRGTNHTFTLIKAINIPVAPNKYWYKSKSEYLYYTLLFPAIPKSTTHIDIIEKEGGDGTFFNFYGVSLCRIAKSPIRIFN